MEKQAGPLGVRKGAWTSEEDIILKNCIHKYGEGRWHEIPSKAGLNRCRKSCRLRWLNYLQPNIKREDFTVDEVDLIIRLHKLLGNRWSLIAGRLPGRTANGVKNYWNTHLHKKMVSHREDGKHKEAENRREKSKVIKPQARTFTKNGLSWVRERSTISTDNNIVQSEDNNLITNKTPPLLPPEEDATPPWWENLILDKEGGSHETTTSPLSWSEMEPTLTSLLPENVSTPEGKEVDFLLKEGRSNWEEPSFVDLWDLLNVEWEMRDGVFGRL